MTKQVIIQTVESNSAKVNWLTSVVARNFFRRERVLVCVENLTVAQFVDDLLWEKPQSAFLPHVQEEAESTSRIVITRSKKNLNNAFALINLCKAPAAVEGVEKIFEVLDVKKAEAKQVMQEKEKFYQERGYEILRL
jgi:DNA polymerase IIIc chi subunit